MVPSTKKAATRAGNVIKNERLDGEREDKGGRVGGKKEIRDAWRQATKRLDKKVEDPNDISTDFELGGNYNVGIENSYAS